MNFLKYILLISLLWGISSFTLVILGDKAGSYSSYLTYILLLIYYFLSKKGKLLFPFIILGSLYFLISGLIYVEDSEYFIYESIKYFILMICAAELARSTTLQQFCFLLFLGSLSILAHALFFTDGYGRYSGFYLNPNGAAFVCLIGYCLTFGIKKKSTKLIYLFVFTFTGILTFSRFFFLMWVFISLLAVISDKKNAKGLVIGLGTVVVLFSVAAVLQVNTQRFSALEGLLSNNTDATFFTEDSRTGEWSGYFDDILDAPIFGNGYKSFSGIENVKQGVHNTYLMIIGESGILPFLALIFIHLYILMKSFKFFNDEVTKPLIVLSLMAISMVMHNYFNNEFILFATIWIFVNIQPSQTEDSDILTPES